MPAEALAEIDLFDRLQLESVLKICRSCTTLSEAGRCLYGASRLNKTSINDSDHLKKYLSRFDLDWTAIKHSK